MISKYFVFVIIIIYLQCGMITCKNNFNVFDKIKSGFKIAGEFLSSEHASTVANLVTKALGAKPSPSASPNNKKDDQPQPQSQSNNIFSGFLRLFGFQSRQISAIAINSIILIAQLIASSLSAVAKPKQERIEEDKPFEWMLQNSFISHIVKDAEDASLSDNIIDYITERSLDEDTGCVQLLMCKMKPFVSEMQRALKERGRNVVKGYGVLYNYFPNATVLADNGDKCEKKYYYCSIPL